MVNTINMQDIRHLNLFEKITKVSTRFCFGYNDAIYFSVPRRDVSKAVGEGAKNLKRLSQIIGKRIRVVPRPKGIEDAKDFFSAVVSPAEFRDIEIKDDEIVITAGGTQNKATLMGRNKKKLFELQKVSENFFGKSLSIA